MYGSFAGSAPACSGTQYPGAIPCGKNMPTTRPLEGAAAVCARAVAAGTIASSNGSAKVTPAPLRNIRRGICFFETNMLAAPLFTILVARRLRLTRNGRVHALRVHLKRLALDDAEDERGEAVVVLCGIPRDGADQRHVLILDAAAQAIRQQFFGHDLHELTGVSKQPFPQTRRAVDFRAVVHLGGRVDGRSLLVRSPQANAVEILEREADRVHQTVALDAVRADPMVQHLLPHRRLLRIPGGIARPGGQRRHVW